LIKAMKTQLQWVLSLQISHNRGFHSGLNYDTNI